jgi:hypothetical protein
MKAVRLATVAFLMMSAVPAFAQIPQSAPTSNGGQGGQHAEMRACMIQHLPGLKEQVMQHMQQFRSANPGATREVRQGERRSFMQQLRQANAPAIQAARAACRGTR